MIPKTPTYGTNRSHALMVDFYTLYLEVFHRGSTTHLYKNEEAHLLDATDPLAFAMACSLAIMDVRSPDALRALDTFHIFVQRFEIGLEGVEV
ncbi:MAG: hypothetical protein GY871_04380 [Actinomycetales bacterium]|nr:hypothetical protein [Actinomycetales bacterium]